MSDIDEVSKLLGILTAQNDQSAQQMVSLMQKFDNMQQDVQDIKQIAKEALDKAEQLEERLDEDIEPDVQDYKKLKQRGIGVLGIIGIGSGAAGAGLREVLSKFIS